MKHGTIVRNLWQPSYESLLVYMGTSGRYAKCLWRINGELHGIHNFFKTVILNDREHFPIVGYVDYEAALNKAIDEGLQEEDYGGVGFIAWIVIETLLKFMGAA